MPLVALVLCSVLALAWCEGVLELDSSNFQKTLAENDCVLVNFYAPWCEHCKALAPEYEKVAMALQNNSGKFVVAKINADKHSGIRNEYYVTQYPVIKLFTLKDTLEYEGDYSSEEILSWVNENVPGSKGDKLEGSLVTLTDENFDSVVHGGSKNVLVDFYAPWCGYCKKFAPVWEQLANKLSNSKDLVVAQIDADRYTSVASKYEINAYPTIKLFNRDHPTGLRYTGMRTIEALSGYVQDLASKTSERAEGMLDSIKDSIDIKNTYEKASNKTKDAVNSVRDSVKDAINGTLNKGHDVLENMSGTFQEKFPEVVKAMKEHYREYSEKLTDDQRALYTKIYSQIAEHLEKDPEYIKNRLQAFKSKGLDKMKKYAPTVDILNMIQPLIEEYDDSDELDEL